jgi:hypothetical protein
MSEFMDWKEERNRKKTTLDRREITGTVQSITKILTHYKET